MIDDLVKRLRGEVILERFEGGHVSQMRNPDGPEAADRIDKLEAALIDILKVPRSEASWGIALVIAHHALKEGKDD